MLRISSWIYLFVAAVSLGLAPSRAEARDPPIWNAQAQTGSFEVTTASTGLGLTDLLDVILQVDARSWMVNRYVKKSMRNAHYLLSNRGATTYTAYGEYDYEGFFGRAPGWVKVAVVDGNLTCLEFWDQPGVCRPPWISLSQQRFFKEMVNQSADMLNGDD